MNSKTTAANNHAPRPAVAPADTITLLVFKGFSAQFCCRQVSLPKTTTARSTTTELNNRKAVYKLMKKILFFFF